MAADTVSTDVIAKTLRHHATRSITASVCQAAATSTIHQMAEPALQASAIWLRRMGEGLVTQTHRRIILAMGSLPLVNS